MKKRKDFILLILILIGLFIGGKGYKNISLPKENKVPVYSAFEEEKENTEKNTGHYAVSSSNDIATEVGNQVLGSGGNAVDAAIAMAYTLAVVEPYSSGLGGGGSMLVYDPATDTCYDYDYRASAGEIEDPKIGVPGMVAGMQYIAGKHGSRPMEELLQPAIYFAENGFAVDPKLAERIGKVRRTIAESKCFFDKNGNPLREGEKLCQMELAETLKQIQKDGAESFYQGTIAKDIARDTNLTEKDLDDYRVVEKKPLKANYRGYQIFSANAPMSGLTLLQMLKMEEMMNLPKAGEDCKGYVDQLEKITSAAYTDRYRYLGDPEFSDEKLTKHLKKDYLKEMLADEQMEFLDDQESTETTSFSVIDQEGLCVSCTNTISHFFGCGQSVDGFFLNNTNTNFSDSPVNQYQPGRRSRTYAAPAIVAGQGGYLLAIGSPGGNNIPSILFGVLADILKYNTDPQEAIDKARILWNSDQLVLEELDDADSIPGSDQIDKKIWKESGFWWGGVSLAGRNADKKAFAAYDKRRGATKAVAVNDEE